MTDRHKKYGYFDCRKYRIGYSRDSKGGEAIVIVDKPIDEVGWSKGQVTHACYFNNRVELNRLPKLINSIFKENQDFYSEECITDSGWSAPSAEDIRVSTAEYDVFQRDYADKQMGWYWGSNVESVEISDSDLARTVDLIKNGLIKLDSRVKGNYQDFGKLNATAPDCRLVALTLATIQIGEEPQDFRWLWE